MGDKMRALSVSEANDVKLWDLDTKEFIHSFNPESSDLVLDVYVNWARMEAMAVLDTQVELWDLEEPDNNPLSVKNLPTRIIKAATISPAEEPVLPQAPPSEPETVPKDAEADGVK